MMRPTLVLMLTLVLSATAQADPRPPTGLLGRAGALPATIPLQIRAPEGQDYLATLSRDKQPVLQGYLRGGEVLRLLAPPGRLSLTIAAGPPASWSGDGFGDAERSVAAAPPLDFRITEDSRREGHSLTVAEQDGELTIVTHEDRTLCQVADWTTRQVTRTTPQGTRLRWLETELDARQRPCD